LCTIPETVETRRQVGRLLDMHGKRLHEWDSVESDRKMIRVQVPRSDSGITAALRRAFEAAADEPSDHDFAALLARLN
jgi:hypothetical protein